ncbi:hypothetical protein NDU88_002144 [Pleurodeles waltl]|uniref:Uncharacterized protein n=1 Tax=Pleurodeles waltl TaxID=8319 RepID=A0AAV7MWJ6_PLEWA|nr:hypothetical protein NDU88_002144 [Pleurodeles waltl]
MPSEAGPPDGKGTKTAKEKVERLVGVVRAAKDSIGFLRPVMLGKAFSLQTTKPAGFVNNCHLVHVFYLLRFPAAPVVDPVAELMQPTGRPKLDHQFMKNA